MRDDLQPQTNDYRSRRGGRAHATFPLLTIGHLTESQNPHLNREPEGQEGDGYVLTLLSMRRLRSSCLHRFARSLFELTGVLGRKRANDRG